MMDRPRLRLHERVTSIFVSEHTTRTFTFHLYSAMPLEPVEMWLLADLYALSSPPRGSPPRGAKTIQVSSKDKSASEVKPATPRAAEAVPALLGLHQPVGRS